MNHTTFTELHAALLETIAAVAPELKAVTAYERLPERATVPRAMLEVTDAQPDGAEGDIGTEQFAVRVSFSVFVIGDPREEAAAKLAVRSLAVALGARLNRRHPGGGVIGGNILCKGIYPDVVAAAGRNAAGRNAAAFVEVMRVDCEVSAVLLPDVWDWPDEEVQIVMAEGIPEFIAPPV